MAMITGGELILKCLQKEGIDKIFGISDEGYHPIMLASSSYDIRFISPRHEAAAAHMAQGIHKTTGDISVVLGGGGPGTANLISGVICAAHEGVPLIAITAQRRKEVVYPNKTGVFQGCDQLDYFKPFTKWNAVAHLWERIPELIQRAFRECTSGRPGAVHIDVPDSVMYEVGDDSKFKFLEPHQYRSLTPLEPATKDIQEAAKLIASAKNPLMMAGTGVLNSKAWDDFRELVELLNCPATTSFAGRTAMPDNHPNNLLVYNEGCFTCRREADVVLAVGTCLGEIDLPFDFYWGDENQKIIQIDIEPRHIGVNRPVHLGVVGDAKTSLKALVECLKKMGVKPSDGFNAVKYKEMLAEEQAAGFELIAESLEEGKIHPVQSIITIGEVFPEETIKVFDGGNTAMFASIFSEFTKPLTAVGNLEFGHLGTGIPSAIGAKLANPDKDVCCITGDGAAGFNIMEMETALREKVKITVIVHAEGAWSLEEVGLEMEGVPMEQRGPVEMTHVRWDKIAEAIGCHGEFVDKLEDLHGAIKRSIESDLPALVCVKTDRQMNLFPPGLEPFTHVYFGVPEEGAES